MPSVIRGDDNFDTSSLPAPSSAQVGSAIAALGFGNVGTYVYAREMANNVTFRLGGSTVAGSTLMPWATDISDTYLSSERLSGTWAIMGGYSPVVGGNDDPESIFLRIA